METAYQQLTDHVTYAIKKFNMKPSEAVKFIFDDWPILTKQAVAELSKQNSDPQHAFLSHAQSYERQGDNTADCYRQAALSRPDLYAAYDDDVTRRGKASLTETSARIDQRVKAYMNDHGEQNYLTALRQILAQSLHGYQESESATQQLLDTGEDVAKATGVTLTDALLAVCDRDRQLSKRVASEFLAGELQKKISADASGTARALVLQEVVKAYPDVAKMSDAGIATPTALSEIFSNKLQA